MAGREDIFQKAMNMGHSAAWDQQWDKAVESYQQALEEFPDRPKALSSLGLALFEMQRYEESLHAYQRAAQSAPTDPVPSEKVGQLSERVGNIQEAIQAFLKAAELYIKNQEADKALANWGRVTQLDSEHVNAHSYLALVHERLHHNHQAVTEYLIVASLLQRSGNTNRAAEMIANALRLAPTSPEARQAQTLLKGGQLLPKPVHNRGGTGPLRMAQIRQLESPRNTEINLDPVAEALKLSLTRLAEILFDFSDGEGAPKTPKHGIQEIVHGSGELDLKLNERTKIMLLIGQAIDMQTKGQEVQAIGELEKALAAGFLNPALFFDLGYLCSKTDRLESALRHLQTAVKNSEYALGARLLMAQILRQLDRLAEAVIENMEALKVADALIVPPDQANEIRLLYEPLIEANAHLTDTVVMERICDNVSQMLLCPDWRDKLLMAREQLPKSAEGSPPMPVAEMLAQAHSSQVIETLGKVRALAQAGHVRSAIDEAFNCFKYAPTYLPLHTLIGDLLIQQGRTQDAITKYTVVAEAYSVRGESTQAIDLLRRIVEVAPMDMVIRNRLINQLAASGMVDEAISEYFGLADIYYRLAELDMARKTFTTALRLAQQGGANRTWSVKLMRRMADIDMQRLDWRQALRVFEQIRTLDPDDATVRRSLVDLYIRLTQFPQANAELENFLAHLQRTGRRGEAIQFLEDLVNEYPTQFILRRALAEEYRQAKRITDAVVQLDVLGDLLLNSGDRDGAIQTMEAIMAMNPPNREAYKTLLSKLKSVEQ